MGLINKSRKTTLSNPRGFDHRVQFSCVDAEFRHRGRAGWIRWCRGPCRRWSSSGRPRGRALRRHLGALDPRAREPRHAAREVLTVLAVSTQPAPSTAPIVSERSHFMAIDATTIRPAGARRARRVSPRDAAGSRRGPPREIRSGPQRPGRQGRGRAATVGRAAFPPKARPAGSRAAIRGRSSR